MFEVNVYLDGDFSKSLGLFAFPCIPRKGEVIGLDIEKTQETIIVKVEGVSYNLTKSKHPFGRYDNDPESPVIINVFVKKTQHPKIEKMWMPLQ